MTRYSFVRTLVEDPEHPGEILLDLGDELCEQMGWKPGDTITWTDNGDGTFTLKKADSKDIEPNV
jgi:hypothetical protein